MRNFAEKQCIEFNWKFRLSESGQALGIGGRLSVRLHTSIIRSGA